MGKGRRHPPALQPGSVVTLRWLEAESGDAHVASVTGLGTDTEVVKEEATDRTIRVAVISLVNCMEKYFNVWR